MVSMEQRLENSATFPMWLSSSLKSREKTHNHSVTSGLSKLNIDPQVTSTPSSSPTTSPEEHFKHENHSQLILSKMNQYYLNGKLKDVILIAGERRLEAHRIVLSAASDYFAAMFTNDFGEANQNEIELQGVDPDALETLVCYCYTGAVELEEDTVECLMATACLLQLPEVVEACSTFLIRQLHPSNCLGIRLFADSQSCTRLLQVAHDYTANHFIEVIGCQEFILLPADEIAKLLASDDLNVPNEELMFQALMLWLRHDLPERKKELPHLLSLIKLPLISPGFIADHVESNLIFREDRVCQELIVEALKYHLLPERRSTLQSQRTRPRKSTVGSLYIVGGMDASTKGPTSVDKFCLRTNSWSSPTASMTGRRLQFGVAVVDNKIYVVGGRDGLKTLSTVECWDPWTKVWSSMPPMATHRHGLGVASLEGPLYAVGGHDGWSYLNSVERWDPVTRQWSFVAPMNSQRSTVGVAALNGKLYAVGGRDGSSCLRTVECYDPHTNRWTLVAPMSKRRGGVGVAVAHGFLYAFGGHDAPASNPSAARFDCVERYDPLSDSWTIVTSMKNGRDAMGVAFMGDRLFIVGGFDGQAYLNFVEAYDPLTNLWQQFAPLPSGRAGACIAVVRDTVPPVV
ncbi:hypothetical protein GHT06_010494 [Daphnia sinensis]|uniref:Kelch-like protein diablo n=1 Tax=Daphnia sinensis TaxID=1820382 RepID=A0AAD5KYY0_9CRUS|nr:hypothetical protein GHT06_010494 [Daphnia sinensis]